jgi:UDP-N-acetylglucosamine 2-epimerase (non-hydrolysing)
MTGSAPRRLLFVLGTRPEIIKMAPVVLAARQAGTPFAVTVLHTGQHLELAEEMFRVFGITPDIDLAVMQANQDLFTLTARIMEGLSQHIKPGAFDCILVQGDTTSAFLGALAGYYTRIPVAHVEAGLRTQTKFSPFPEEMNRRLVGPLADVHFPPTERARASLRGEGIPDSQITVTGNTVIDALFWSLARPHTPGPDLAELLDRPGRLILVTTHRRENFGEPHRQVFAALREIVDGHGDVRILFPVHPNPNVRAEVAACLGNHDRIRVCAPLGYLDFLRTMQRSCLILSDSGGVQEEAPSLKKPVLVLRESTERPEGIESGALKLVGTDRERIVREARRLLDDPSAVAEMTCRPNPYGDGKAAERILGRIESFLAAGENR